MTFSAPGRKLPIMLGILGSALLMNSCGSSELITDQPIPFDAERLELTRQYMSDRYGLEDQVLIKPKMVVLHWTAIPTYKRSYAAFKSGKLPNWRPEITGAGALNVSAHFLIKRNGKIIRLMPENLMARHVIGLNHCAIGVENVGGTSNKPMTQKQIEANIRLVRYLKERYDIEYVIGHHEYQQFEGHPYWKEKDSSYRTKKSDPGEAFMAQVRAAFPDGTFKSLPIESTAY